MSCCPNKGTSLPLLSILQLVLFQSHHLLRVRCWMRSHIHMRKDCREVGPFTFYLSGWLEEWIFEFDSYDLLGLISRLHSRSTIFPSRHLIPVKLLILPLCSHSNIMGLYSYIDIILYCWYWNWMLLSVSYDILVENSILNIILNKVLCLALMELIDGLSALMRRVINLAFLLKTDSWFSLFSPYSRVIKLRTELTSLHCRNLDIKNNSLSRIFADTGELKNDNKIKWVYLALGYHITLYIESI